ncbi:LptF/LptG family permease [Kordiimonas marina]|uniref:LptF/LptG family permease n=1 Tax=Kordiimonas marina TaxID=2872312 RepID=UPI001FF1789A|nr:LptF/LptG family permease [Kordiimonas marina]MCJ9430575.1 LptF/LptG family permease [Kordiimonas marina]
MMRLRHMRRVMLPSKELAAYVVRLFLTRYLAMLFLLVVLLQAIDLMNKTDELLAAKGATAASLIQYVQWRAPELISQFMPFAALMATLFTLAGLNQHSEVIVMRAAGLAPGQIMAPMYLAAGFIVIVHILFHDFVVVDVSAKLAYWQSNDYSVSAMTPPEGRQDVWIEDKGLVLEARSATRAGNHALLDTVSLYRRDARGLLTQSISADFAVNETGGPDWTFYGVRHFDLTDGQMTAAAQEVHRLNVPLERIYSHIDKPDQERIGPLYRAIRALKAVGVKTFELDTALLHRFTRALATLIMPLLGAFVAFGPPRMGSGIARVVLGMAIGFSYFVVENYMVAMGSMGIVPPLLATLSTPLLYFMAGLSIILRFE